MFKAVKHDPVTYCDGDHHVLLTIPTNPRAYETYGVDLTACDCQAAAEPPTVDVEPPATHEEFDKL